MEHNAEDRDQYNRFPQIQPGDLGVENRDPNARREPVEENIEDDYFEDVLEHHQEDARREPINVDVRVQPQARHAHLNRLGAMAQILQQIEEEEEEPVPIRAPIPHPVPHNLADRDYLNNLNDAFGRLNMANLIPPPPPPVRRPVYKLPTTGVDTTKHLVRHQIQVSELLAQQQQTINNLLFWAGNPELQQANIGAMRDAAAQAAQTALELKAQAVHYQANMQRAAHVTDRYSSMPTMPQWEHLHYDAPLGRPCDIIAACGKFDPSKPDADFGIVWDNLRFYGTNHGYRENNYRMALSFLLEGEAKRVFHDHMDVNPIPPLEVIVETIYKAYAKPRSTIDDKQALKDVIRQANEPLPRCIARGTIAIDRQRYMHDQRDWPILRKNMIRELVYQVVEKPTQKFINWLENDSIATTGIVCDVDRLIEMVDQEEKRHGWIPRQAKEVVFTAASTGIFHNQKSDKQQPHHKKGPQQQQPHHQRQPQQHPNQQPHQQGPQQQVNKGKGKTVQTFSTNATDLDGDDTMTGRDSSRNRSKKRFQKGKNRTHSAGADQNRSRTDQRDNSKQRRRYSNSPAGGSRKQVKFPEKQPWYEKDLKSDKKKKKQKGSSQNQSGSKNVIVRVDKAGLKGTFCLNKTSLITDPNVQPDFIISESGSEN